MGLNSGEVVVGKIGDDLRMDYTAQGHTVGLAQRMEQLAEPDTCYLTGATAALVGRLLRARRSRRLPTSRASASRCGVFELRGLGAAAHALRRLARARPLALRRPRRRHATLEAALEQAQAGNGQVVGVVAEAGHRQEPALLRVRSSAAAPAA